MKSILRSLLLAASLFSVVPALAQPAAPAAPATRPAGAKPTAEQQAAIDAYNNADPATPLQKKSMAVNRRDGTPNPDFNKPDPTFMRMHGEFVERSRQPAEVLFIGDSITQGWRNGGKDGAEGPKDIWEKSFGKYHAANFGISGDRTEHVLWRIQDGELDGFVASPPRVVVIMIGTNNAGHTEQEIAAGTTAVVKAVHAKLPESKILLLSIFPRAVNPEDGPRQKVQAANAILKDLDGSEGGKVKYFELWKPFLTQDGVLTKEIMPDALHPNAKGYQIWADAMGPVLEEMMK